MTNIRYASQTTEYRATQLVSSIKHKLSHAMCSKREEKYPFREIFSSILEMTSKKEKSIWGARPRSRKGVISEVKQVARQVQLWGHLHNQKCTKVKSKRNTNDKNDYNLNDTNVVTNNYDENDKNVVENTNGSKLA